MNGQVVGTSIALFRLFIAAAILSAWLAPMRSQAADTLSATGAVWKYLDNGVDQGTAWRELNFNDTGWSNGVAQLGFGDGDEATVVTSNRQATFYFRRSFEVSDPTIYTN